MSASDSESASGRANKGTGEYKNFRMTSRDRLLYEMLQSTSSESKSWKVLIMDKVTVKVMSSSCKMADITDQGISLVEDLFRRRQPLPSLDAIYFIQPSKENIVMFLSDMSGREPLYKKAFVFFCQPVPKELVNHIKSDMSVVPRIGALREMNLEFFPVDTQVFVTDHDMAMEELYGETSQNARKYDACMNALATRIATVFASLKELPYVRYQVAKDPDRASANELIPSKLASAIWDRLTNYKSSIPNYPQKETCEFLILDRSVDQIAPVIHEWTYDAMCHDLLEMEGNKLVLEVTNKATGQPENKEILLEDSDPVWLEIRHLHIAEASERLHDKMTNFASKNKAAALSQASRDGAELSTRDLQKMVQALPQYTEQMEKLSLHVEIAGKINKIIRDMELRELGQLEQDIVFGDAGTKEIITFLRTHQDASVENKLRLLMIYACVHPDKFEGDKASKIMQLAKLSAEDMKAVKKMRLLAGSSETKKKPSGSFSLTFDGQRKKVAARKDKTSPEEETWALSKFYPMLEELIENVNKGDLSKNDYHYINEPAPINKERNQSQSASVSTTTTTGPRSMRSRRTATWARPHHSDDGSNDSVLRHSPSDYKMMGSRIFIFIIGGATRSELRACYKLTTKLRREIVLGATSIDDPPQYLTKLKLFSEKGLSVEGLKL
ncbi:protein transport Sec1a [Beta vulgaris subsp. vulgaris]|uniref:protein transport Sec1a n=1 Tax=Beta vulgaris subsp. vulgaris TaxID=3555 RepID=UPI002036E503|nr:protein transport Sec1a [Beta vulgaris subsp. vulgaris]